MKTPRSLRPVHSQLITGVILCLLALACITKSTPENKARHAWAGSNGIVVPHDSFPTDCLLCHVEGSWSELREDFTFDHEAETGVKLEGAHAQAQCLRCHNDRGPVTLFAAGGCAGCHEDIHRAELGTQCSSCHGEKTWALRDEIALHNRTRFPLVGSHAAADCWTCHPGGEVGNWVRVDVDCTTCHGDQALTVQSPDHSANGWIAACDRCHIPTTWDGAGFNHFTFQLTGAHRSTDCSACHVNDVFAGTPTDCAGCHSQDYANTTDPDHAASGFPMSCELCHDTSTWEGAIFSHAGIANGCVACHQDDYDGTTDPDHAAGGFSTSCEDCHSTNSWDGAAFQHQGIVDGCVNCHLDNYNATTNPNHVAGGISQSCEQCHVTTTWLGANFDHRGITSGCVTCHQDNYNATTDPNHMAAGVGTSCEQCHGTDFWRPANMNHAGITTNCAVCHTPEYNQTTQPNHAAAGFPPTCELCHSTNGWTPADFNHNFPINNGDHSGLDCIECHIQPMNYRVFSCIDCHQHNQNDMADEHTKVGNYVWSTPACYGCHPNGDE